MLQIFRGNLAPELCRLDLLVEVFDLRGDGVVLIGPVVAPALMRTDGAALVGVVGFVGRQRLQNDRDGAEPLANIAAAITGRGSRCRRTPAVVWKEVPHRRKRTDRARVTRE